MASPLQSVARACALALGLCAAAAAHADVTYTVSFAGAQFQASADGPVLVYDGGYTVTTPEPITGAQFLTPSSCGMSASAAGVLQCSEMQYIDADGFGTGYEHVTFSADILAFPGAGLRGSMWFEAGSLSHDGVYDVIRGSIFGPDGSEYGSFVLNGTLTVTGAVPEPASAVLMTLGVAGLLAARRRRRG